VKLNVRPENKVTENSTETYMAFRSAIMKPTNEDEHLRHILRFYMARAMIKRGEADIYIFPEVKIDDEVLLMDLVAGSEENYKFTICEPGSITPDTEDVLNVLKDVPDIEVFIVHSQYGKSGNVEAKFKEQLETKKFHLLAVVPPPFDDVYEYDIWMFETTFRNLFDEL